MPGRAKPASVDAYLAAVPSPQRAALEELRRTIRAAAPKADEVISYGIPSYKEDGYLVGFAAFRDHCSFFPGTTVRRFKGELRGYATAKGTVHFTPDRPLPAALVKRIVKARLEENRARVRPRARRGPARAPERGDPARIAEAAERTLRRVAPRLRHVVKYGAPTYRGRGDVCTLGVWSTFVSVGFWNGAVLAPRHALLQGTGKRTRLVKLRSVADARSAAFAALLRDAVRLDAERPAHEGGRAKARRTTKAKTRKKN